MKHLSLGMAAAFVSTAAAAEPPTLWYCLGDRRVECRGAECAAADIADVVQLSLLNRTYERCADLCVSGRSTRWVEGPEGSVIVIADDYPQHLVLRPDNGFTDVATVDGVTVITEGRCFPALKDLATSETLLDIYRRLETQSGHRADEEVRP